MRKGNHVLRTYLNHSLSQDGDGGRRDGDKFGGAHERGQAWGFTGGRTERGALHYPPPLETGSCWALPGRHKFWLPIFKATDLPTLSAYLATFLTLFLLNIHCVVSSSRSPSITLTLNQPDRPAECRRTVASRLISLAG